MSTTADAPSPGSSNAYFSHAGLDWQKHVVVDPRFLRPAEVDHLIGGVAKAKAKLGWKPEVDSTTLVKMMVDADIERVRAGHVSA